MKVIHLFAFFLTIALNAQVLDIYPKGQDFYEGGFQNFYKDVHLALLKQKLKPCENKKELYGLTIIVYPEKNIKIVKDFDSLNIKKNKCAYDLAINVVKYTNQWKPAEVEGKKYAAVKRKIYFYPDDLFENYQASYTLLPFLKEPSYKKGSEAFMKELHDNFMSLFSDYDIQGSVVLLFDIDEEGHMKNARLENKVDNPNIKNDLIRTFKRVKGAWNPASIKDVPVKYLVKIPINFKTSFNQN